MMARYEDPYRYRANINIDYRREAERCYYSSYARHFYPHHPHRDPYPEYQATYTKQEQVSVKLTYATSEAQVFVTEYFDKPDVRLKIFEKTSVSDRDNLVVAMLKKFVEKGLLQKRNGKWILNVRKMLESSCMMFMWRNIEGE